MATMTLEAEKNELIRRILDENDIEILEKVPYWTKAKILADFNEACKEIKQAQEGELEAKPLEDLLNKL